MNYSALEASVSIVEPEILVNHPVSVPLTELYQLLVQSNSETLDLEKTAQILELLR